MHAAVFAGWLVLRGVCCAGGVWLLFRSWFGALVDCVLPVVGCGLGVGLVVGLLP